MLVVAEHDACAERAGVMVGRLHQLPTGRRQRTGQMAGQIFGRIAHVEQISRAC
jgi:hypothetical protein